MHPEQPRNTHFLNHALMGTAWLRDLEARFTDTPERLRMIKRRAVIAHFETDNLTASDIALELKLLKGFVELCIHLYSLQKENFFLNGALWPEQELMRLEDELVPALRRQLAQWGYTAAHEVTDSQLRELCNEIQRDYTVEVQFSSIKTLLNKAETSPTPVNLWQAMTLLTRSAVHLDPNSLGALEAGSELEQASMLFSNQPAVLDSAAAPDLQTKNPLQLWGLLFGFLACHMLIWGQTSLMKASVLTSHYATLMQYLCTLYDLYCAFALLCPQSAAYQSIAACMQRNIPLSVQTRAKAVLNCVALDRIDAEAVFTMFQSPFLPFGGHGIAQLTRAATVNRDKILSFCARLLLNSILIFPMRQRQFQFLEALWQGILQQSPKNVSGAAHLCGALIHTPWIVPGLTTVLNHGNFYYSVVFGSLWGMALPHYNGLGFALSSVKNLHQKQPLVIYRLLLGMVLFASTLNSDPSFKILLSYLLWGIKKNEYLYLTSQKKDTDHQEISNIFMFNFTLTPPSNWYYFRTPILEKTIGIRQIFQLLHTNQTKRDALEQQLGWVTGQKDNLSVEFLSELQAGQKVFFELCSSPVFLEQLREAKSYQEFIACFRDQSLQAHQYVILFSKRDEVLLQEYWLCMHYSHEIQTQLDELLYRLLLTQNKVTWVPFHFEGSAPTPELCFVYEPNFWKLPEQAHPTEYGRLWMSIVQQYTQTLEALLGHHPEAQELLHQHCMSWRAAEQVPKDMLSFLNRLGLGNSSNPAPLNATVPDLSVSQALDRNRKFKLKNEFFSNQILAAPTEISGRVFRVWTDAFASQKKLIGQLLEARCYALQLCALQKQIRCPESLEKIAAVMCSDGQLETIETMKERFGELSDALLHQAFREWVDAHETQQKQRWNREIAQYRTFKRPLGPTHTIVTQQLRKAENYWKNYFRPGKELYMIVDALSKSALTCIHHHQNLFKGGWFFKAAEQILQEYEVLIQSKRSVTLRSAVLLGEWFKHLLGIFLTLWQVLTVTLLLPFLVFYTATMTLELDLYAELACNDIGTKKILNQFSKPLAFFGLKHLIAWSYEQVFRRFTSHVRIFTQVNWNTVNRLLNFFFPSTIEETNSNYITTHSAHSAVAQSANPSVRGDFIEVLATRLTEPGILLHWKRPDARAFTPLSEWRSAQSNAGQQKTPIDTLPEAEKIRLRKLESLLQGCLAKNEFSEKDINDFKTEFWEPLTQSGGAEWPDFVAALGCILQTNTVLPVLRDWLDDKLSVHFGFSEEHLCYIHENLTALIQALLSFLAKPEVFNLLLQYNMTPLDRALSANSGAWMTEILLDKNIKNSLSFLLVFFVMRLFQSTKKQRVAFALDRWQYTRASSIVLEAAWSIVSAFFQVLALTSLFVACTVSLPAWFLQALLYKPVQGSQLTDWVFRLPGQLAYYMGSSLINTVGNIVLLFFNLIVHLTSSMFSKKNLQESTQSSLGATPAFANRGIVKR